MCINIKPHSVLNFSGRKENGATALFLTHLSSQSWSQRQVFKSNVFWEVVEAWTPCPGPGDDAFASVLEKLPHICWWTQTASPWWQGLRCCCTRLWTKGDVSLVWGFMEAADSPQGDEDTGRRFRPNTLKLSIFPTWATCCGFNCAPPSPAPEMSAFLVAALYY